MLDFMKEIVGSSYTEEMDEKVRQAIGKQFVARADFNAMSEAKKGLETQLTDANTAIEGFKANAGDAEKTAQAIADWKKKYNDDTARLKAENEGLKYTHNIEALSLKEKFSSEAARKAFVADLAAKKLPYEDGKLTGYDDFKKSYMEADPGAFAADNSKARTPAKVSTGAEHAEGGGAGESGNSTMNDFIRNALNGD